MNYLKNCPKNLCKELTSKRIKEKQSTVFIIGGGPSIKRYLPDISVLDNKHVIATNNAYKLFPNAILTHFADKKWYLWHTSPKYSHDIHNNFFGPVTTADISTKTSYWANNKYVTQFIKTNKDAKKFALEEKHDILASNNSGHQAINIAYHIGYKNIVLLGFDLRVDEKETHWHNDHLKPTNKANYTYNMIPGFDRLADEIKQTPINVYNVNKESAIKKFEFANLDNFL